MFELVGQSSDMMVRAKARSLGELFGDSALGLVAVILSDTGSRGASEPRRLVLEASRLEDLLQDFLSGVLALAQRRWLTRRVEASVVDVSEGEMVTWRIEAALFGESWDPRTLPPEREVKAITYQGLRVDQVDHGWIAEYVVDL